MSNVVNLNRARKRKARAQAAQQAAENRVRFGRTKAQKQRDTAETEAMRRKLDHAKLDPPRDDRDDRDD
jgi:hypothetical protein